MHIFKVPHPQGITLRQQVGLEAKKRRENDELTACLACLRVTPQLDLRRAPRRKPDSLRDSSDHHHCYSFQFILSMATCDLSIVSGNRIRILCGKKRAGSVACRRRARPRWRCACVRPFVRVRKSPTRARRQEKLETLLDITRPHALLTLANPHIDHRARLC